MKSFSRFMAEGPDSKVSVIQEHSLYEEAKMDDVFVLPPYVGGGEPAGLRSDMEMNEVWKHILPLGYANPREVMTFPTIKDLIERTGGPADVGRNLPNLWKHYKPIASHQPFANFFGKHPIGIDWSKHNLKNGWYYFAFPSPENPNGFWLAQMNGTRIKVVDQLPEAASAINGAVPAPAPNPQSSGDESEAPSKPVIGDGVADTLEELGIGKDEDYGRAKAKIETKYRQSQIESMLEDIKNGTGAPDTTQQQKIGMLTRRQALGIKTTGTNLKTNLQKFSHILAHAKRWATGTEKIPVLLGGDPGVGKTTFIKQFGRLTGVPVLVIEAPHVVKENLVKIPFIMFKGEAVTKGATAASLSSTDAEGSVVGKTSATEQKKEKTFDIKLAKSNLVSLIQATKKIPESQWVKSISRKQAFYSVIQQDKNVLALSSSFRQNFRCILFLDEYFRTENKTIQNILRGVINGKIGADLIPKDVYVVFAANLKNDDGSFEEIPDNIQVKSANFELPDKDDWKAWFKGRYVSDVADAKELKQAIESKTGDNDDVEEWESGKETRALAKLDFDIDPDFTDKLVDSVGEDLAKTVEVGDDTKIRLSPRRLEELTLSINALLSMPAGKEHGKKILTFLRQQLMDYKTRQVNEALYKRMAAVILEKLDKQGIKLTDKDIVPDTEWTKMLEVQIDLKNKLGSLRKYVPMVTGSPGIGKTQLITKMGIERKLSVIEIECPTITRDDLFGIPLEDRSVVNGEEVLEVTFSDPPLYKRIMDQYILNADNMKKHGIVPDGQYTQILFFDEVTRVADKNIFNGLRKVILEGEFGQVALPDDLMIVGALNPIDSGRGVTELTDHFKDVADPIPAEADFYEWRDTYLVQLAEREVQVLEKKLEQAKLEDAKNPGFSATELVSLNSQGLQFGRISNPLVAKALAWLAEQMQSDKGTVNGPDSDPVKLERNVKPWWWKGGKNDSDVLYVSPRTMVAIYHEWVANVNDDLFMREYPRAYTPDEQKVMYNSFAEDCADGLAAGYETVAKSALKYGAMYDNMMEIAVKLIGSVAFKDHFQPLFNAQASVGKVDLAKYLKMNGYSTKKVKQGDFIAFISGSSNSSEVVDTMMAIFDDIHSQFASTDPFEVVRKYNKIVEAMYDAIRNMPTTDTLKFTIGNLINDIGVAVVGRYRTMWPDFQAKTDIIKEVIDGVHAPIINETYDLVKDQLNTAVN